MTRPAPSPAAAGTLPKRPLLPWLLVVARGQRELAAELAALFRDDARVQVVEDRREDRALLPRPDQGSLAAARPSPQRRRGR